MGTSTAITPIQQRVAKVRELCGRFKNEIAHALPRHLTADRMIELMMLCVRQTPALLECDQASLVGAVLECVRLGLEPGDSRGLAYLIPFHNTKRGCKEVQFVAGYRGLIELAYRSNLVAKIDVRAVFEGDDFRYEYGLEPVLKHIPKSPEDPKRLTHVYAIVKIKNGDAVFDVLDRDRVEQIRRCSRSGQSPSSPWNTHYVAMAKKTVIRQLLKTVPCSAELQKAITLDEMGDANLSQRLNTIIDVGGDDDPVPAPSFGLDDLNRRMEHEAAQSGHDAAQEPPDDTDDSQVVPDDEPPPEAVQTPQKRQKGRQNVQNGPKSTGRAANPVSYPPHEMVTYALHGKQITAEEFVRLTGLPTDQQPAELDRLFESLPTD